MSDKKTTVHSEDPKILYIGEDHSIASMMRAFFTVRKHDLIIAVDMDEGIKFAQLKPGHVFIDGHFIGNKESHRKLGAIKKALPNSPIYGLVEVGDNQKFESEYISGVLSVPFSLKEMERVVMGGKVDEKSFVFELRRFFHKYVQQAQRVLMNTELTIVNQNEIKESLAGLTREELIERINLRDAKVLENAKYIANETAAALDTMIKIKSLVYKDLEIDNSRPLSDGKKEKDT